MASHESDPQRTETASPANTPLDAYEMGMMRGQARRAELRRELASMRETMDPLSDFKGAGQALAHYLYRRIDDFNSIRVFPENATTGVKAKANLANNLGSIDHTKIENGLDAQDILRARATLQKGDIVLVGTLDETSVFALGGPITHSLIYDGENGFINADAVGVVEFDARDTFTRYDVMMIVRPKGGTPEMADQAVDFAKSQLGKPYDFDFEADLSDPMPESYYCSELVATAYKNAGMSVPQPRSLADETLLANMNGIFAIHPRDFLNDNYELVFTSHNLSQGLDGKLNYVDSTKTKES